MKALFITMSWIIAIVVTTSLTGCVHATAADRSASTPARICTVQFRRDALGAAATLPISPTAQGINGADTAITGSYKATRKGWVIVERDGRELWIPKSVILSIEFAQ
jgi:hypothetical protein